MLIIPGIFVDPSYPKPAHTHTQKEKSLESYSPWGCKESESIEQLTHTHTQAHTHTHTHTPAQRALKVNRSGHLDTLRC